MRGSIQYYDVFELTKAERERMAKFLDKRFKIETKKPPNMNRVY